MNSEWTQQWDGSGRPQKSNAQLLAGRSIECQCAPLPALSAAGAARRSGEANDGASALGLNCDVMMERESRRSYLLAPPQHPAPTRLLPLLLLVAGRCSAAQSGGGACSSAADCSLGGECVQSACFCDKTWTGSHCAALNLGKAPKAGAYRHNANGSTSWGGLPVRVGDTYHLFFAEFSNGCGLGSWGTNSQVLKAVSKSPSGPFTSPTLVAPPFHHNPTIAKVPGGPYLMVSIGNGSTPWRGIAPPKQNNCSGPPTGHALADQQRARSGDPLLAYEITMLYSDSVEGPWKHRTTPVLEPGPAAAWDGYVTNPSMFVFPNGSVLLAYRGGPCPIPKGGNSTVLCNAHRINVAVAERWDGVYKRVGSVPAFMEQNEDPGIFRVRCLPVSFAPVSASASASLSLSLSLSPSPSPSPSPSLSLPLPLAPFLSLSSLSRGVGVFLPVAALRVSTCIAAFVPYRISAATSTLSHIILRRKRRVERVTSARDLAGTPTVRTV